MTTTFEDWAKTEEGEHRIISMFFKVIDGQDDPTRYLEDGPHPLTDEEAYKLKVALPPQYQANADFVVRWCEAFLSDQCYCFQDYQKELAERNDPRCPKCNYFALSCVWNRQEGPVFQCSKCGYHELADESEAVDDG